MKKLTFILNLFVLTLSPAIGQPGTFSYDLGEWRITLLSEGQQAGTTGILIGATEEMIREFAPDGTFPNATNAFLLEGYGRKILFDTGYGRELFANMAIAGVSPQDVDAVILTHMHGDHIGGLLVNGEPAFPNALLYVPRAEHGYWTDREAMLAQPENRKAGFRKAMEAMEKYVGSLRIFDPSEAGAPESELLPGIYPLAAYGHTPGHTVFVVEELGGEKIIIWGDLVHAMAIQMPYPGVAVTYDVDPDRAVESRLNILRYVEENRIPVAGMHVAYPGIGTVAASGDGYVFTPAR